MEIDFLASGNHFFLLPFTDVLPLIALFFCLMETYLQISLEFWLVKAYSLASASHYFIYFSDIRNIFLKQILHSG